LGRRLLISIAIVFCGRVQNKGGPLIPEIDIRSGEKIVEEISGGEMAKIDMVIWNDTMPDQLAVDRGKEN
jgi:hypothetical protein